MANVDIIALFQMVMGVLRFSSFNMMSHMFVIDSFYYIEVCSFHSHHPHDFFHRKTLHFVKGFFSVSNKMIIRSVFESILWLITFIDLHTLKHICIFVIQLTCSWWMIISKYELKFSFPILDCEFLHLYLLKKIAHNFFCFVFFWFC